MLLVIGCEKPMAELPPQPRYERQWDYPQVELSQLFKGKKESFVFEVEQVGPHLTYIKTFSLEETAKNKRSQNLGILWWQVRVILDCRRVKQA